MLAFDWSLSNRRHFPTLLGGFVWSRFNIDMTRASVKLRRVLNISDLPWVYDFEAELVMTWKPVMRLCWGARKYASIHSILVPRSELEARARLWPELDKIKCFTSSHHWHGGNDNYPFARREVIKYLTGVLIAECWPQCDALNLHSYSAILSSHWSILSILFSDWLILICWT